MRISHNYVQLRRSIIVNADRAALDDPRVTLLQVINGFQNLFSSNRCCRQMCHTNASLAHNNHSFLCSSSIFCTSIAENVGHRYGSRAWHDPNEHTPIFTRGNLCFQYKRANPPVLRTIPCVKAQLLSPNPLNYAPTFHVTSKPSQHFSVRAPVYPTAPVTHSSTSLLPSLLWNICGTRLWRQLFGSWPEIICGKATKFEPQPSGRTHTRIRVELPGTRS